MRLEVFVDTCWMVINFTMVAFHVKVRKSHINITKKRPDHFREKQAHSRSSDLPYFCSSHSWSCEHMRCTCHMPVSCVNGHFPRAFSWGIPLSFSSPSSLSILCTLFFFFPRPSYIFIQCPSPKAVQGVMFEMSSNKASANILSISKTAETRWICCVICSWLLRLLCWKWGKKLQSTEFQHYPSIHGEVNSCHVTSDSGVTHEHARRIFA